MSNDDKTTVLLLSAAAATALCHSLLCRAASADATASAEAPAVPGSA